MQKGENVEWGKGRSPLEHLFRQHADAAWRVLRRCGLDATTADDGLQQVFMVAGERLGDISPGSERAFLFGVAVRVASRLRHKQRRDALSPALPEPDARAPGADEAYEALARRALLDRLLGELAEPLRVVLVLAEVEGLSKREIALALSIPEGTAASRLRRAKVALRARLTTGRRAEAPALERVAGAPHPTTPAHLLAAR